MYGGRKGFNYVSKYILKDTLWYSYSRRPGLGSVGKDRYIERCVNRFIQTGRFITRMHVPIMGVMSIVTVHSGWQKEARNVLGLRKEGKLIYVKKTQETYRQKKVRLTNGAN
jgi:hypothetical protein